MFLPLSRLDGSQEAAPPRRLGPSARGLRRLAAPASMELATGQEVAPAGLKGVGGRIMVPLYLFPRAKKTVDVRL